MTSSKISTALVNGQAPTHTSGGRRHGSEPAREYRVLVVDDRPSIHDDFERFLSSGQFLDPEIDEFRVLFGSSAASSDFRFDIQHASQGQDAIDLVDRAVANGEPFSVAFVDAQMPPGINGLQTIAACWGLDPELEVVLITGDYDIEWDMVLSELGRTDQLLLLKKPLDPVEVKQVAVAMSEKRRLRELAHMQLDMMESRVKARTDELHAANERLRTEMEGRFEMERELRRAQKLESVGRLAAGIAHEINTPIQFIGDSVSFLSDAFRDLLALYQKVRTLALATNAREWEDSPAILQLRGAEEEADLEFIVQEVPLSLSRTRSGVERVAAIVRGMKVFTPGADNAIVHADLNASIENTLIVSRAEYKYYATVRLELGLLPLVPCYIGEINQVILNLVVNASHAIADRRLPVGQGVIEIRTFVRDNHAVIEVQDNGGGIPETAREHVFEPFFTTKPVGKGTGQGLSISYGIITDHHQGTIDFRVEEGVGTTFTIAIPLQRADPPPAQIDDMFGRKAAV